MHGRDSSTHQYASKNHTEDRPQRNTKTEKDNLAENLLIQVEQEVREKCVVLRSSGTERHLNHVSSINMLGASNTKNKITAANSEACNKSAV